MCVTIISEALSIPSSGLVTVFSRLFPETPPDKTILFFRGFFVIASVICRLRNYDCRVPVFIFFLRADKGKTWFFHTEFVVCNIVLCLYQRCRSTADLPIKNKFKQCSNYISMNFCSFGSFSLELNTLFFIHIRECRLSWNRIRI